MRFSQIDRITELIDGQRLTAVKCLSLSEEYLQDHFPRCPLMPGVIMIEALFQASMWLLRATDRFEHPMVALRSARNIRFRELVEPGDPLMIETELSKRNGDHAEFSAKGTVRGLTAVSGRLTLEQYFVRDRLDAASVYEPYMAAEFKRKFRLLVAPGLELSLPIRQAIGMA
jgi:3-hydroxyacyl-[acyl-carrier-protein] dehydratase